MAGFTGDAVESCFTGVVGSAGRAVLSGFTALLSGLTVVESGLNVESRFMVESGRIPGRPWKLPSLTGRPVLSAAGFTPGAAAPGAVAPGAVAPCGLPAPGAP